MKPLYCDTHICTEGIDTIAYTESDGGYDTLDIWFIEAIL